MTHNQCDCTTPNEHCPRYGWMMGRKWEHCQGINTSPEQREQLLNVYSGVANTPSPTTIQKVGSFTGALLKHAASGGAKADQEILRMRLETCDTCPEKQSTGNCGVCGCLISIKASWKTQGCPLLKWPGDVEAEEKKCGCVASPLPNTA